MYIIPVYASSRLHCVIGYTVEARNFKEAMMFTKPPYNSGTVGARHNCQQKSVKSVQPFLPCDSYKEIIAFTL